MDPQQPAKNKNSFLQNDRRLVCGMFIVYGLCILGLIGATIWGLDRRSKRISANATSTAVALATQQAKATATAIARSTEQARFEVIDRFDDNKRKWRNGYQYDKYWVADLGMEDGTYLWDVKVTKQTFIEWANFPSDDQIEDFDVYVDTKVVEGSLGDVCSGLLFRISPDGWDEGGYYFSLCNNSVVKISYHTEKDGWERLASIQYDGDLADWNRLEIIAHGTHFTFLINGAQIYEMDDDRQKVGGLALVIELSEKAPARVLFDNFGFQSH